MGNIKNDNNYIRNDNHKNNRHRKIIWFNPPFCKHSNINIGNSIYKHFQKNNPLSKIFNRNTEKFSYSCTNNMSKIIDNNKKKLLA